MPPEFLSFFRPTTPVRQKDPVKKKSDDESHKMGSITSTTSRSLKFFCRIPAPVKRKQKSSPTSICTDMSKTLSVKTASTATVERPKTRSPVLDTSRIPALVPVRTSSMPQTSLSTIIPVVSVASSDSDHVSSDDAQESRAAERVKPRTSEVHHISHIRSQSASRSGHWLKIRKQNLSPAELKTFMHLKSLHDRPIKKSEVLNHLMDITGPTKSGGDGVEQIGLGPAGKTDAGHRPLKLAQERYGSAAQREFIDIDPFSNDLWIVKWVPTATLNHQLLSHPSRTDWPNLKSMGSSDAGTYGGVSKYWCTKSVESLRMVQGAEISTIRVVAEGEYK